MTANHPFIIGGRYRNREAEYEVESIDGDSMTVRFDDGRQQTLSVAAQARIWQRIRDDELAEARHSDFTGKDFTPDERLVTWPVRQLVHEILRANFSHPYPPDITDRVCLAIEANPAWGRRYESLAAELSTDGQPAAWKVNNAIGAWTKELTGMVTVKPGVRATSELIQSYSRLGYAKEG